MTLLRNLPLGVCIVLVVFSNGNAQYLINKQVFASSGDQSETAIAYDVTNSNHLMATWNDYSNGVYSRPGFAFSIDGGSNWSSVGILTPSLGYGFDPSCGFDRKGNEYYSYVASTGPGNFGPIAVSITTNDGDSWTTRQVSSSSSVQDKPSLSVDNTGDSYDGRVYVAWNNDLNSATQVLCAYSDNQGQNWSQSAIYQVANSSGQEVRGAELAMAPGGIDYLAYYKGDTNTTGGTGRIYVNTSNNGGASWSSPYTTNAFPSIVGYKIGDLRVSSFPTIAVDPSTGNVYVAYTADDNGVFNIYYFYSTDEGSSWSVPENLTAAALGQHFFPYLSVDSHGVVTLVYYQGNSSSVDVYATESFNYGQSFDGLYTKITSSPLCLYW